MVYVYSRYINPLGSIFVNRYFIAILPAFIVISAIGADIICSFVRDKCLFIFNRPKERIMINIIFVCSLGFILGRTALTDLKQHAVTVNEPYREAAYWIYGQEETHLPNTLVTMTGLWPDFGHVYDDIHPGVNYYITKGWQRPTINLGFITEENHHEWEMVYRFDGFLVMAPWRQEILGKYFDLVDFNREKMVYVYRRKR